MSGSPLPEQSFIKTLMRWLGAFLIVVVIYGGIFYAIYIFNKHETVLTKGGQEALMLEFAMDATAPVVENISETIQQETVTEEQEEEQLEPEVEPEPQPEPEPIVTPPSDMVEEVKPKVEEKPKKEPEKPKKQVASPKPVNPDAQKDKKQQKATAPDINAKSGNKFAGPTTNRQQGSGGTADAGWADKAQRHIQTIARRFERQTGGVKGNAIVLFSYDSNGRVLSTSIAQSSGKKNVDMIAMRIARQSSPLPKPPQGKAGTVRLRVQF